MVDLPARADVVVIGGGVVGASVAYHLASLGCRDVVLLERAKIGSGTTWHAGGNMETYRADPLIGDMVAYTVELFPGLEAESGIQFGWRQPGRVHFTSSPAVLARYRSVPARSRARGVEVEALGPREVLDKLPVISGEGLLGGLWIPNDGRVDPTNLAMAYARAAAKGGARVIEDVRVDRIVTDGRAITGVETGLGTVRTTTVVLAAGLWSTALARTCGVRLPLVALHHFYILTRPCGVAPDLPLYLSYDERIWGREDVGGLIIGVFDSNAVPIEADQLPANFVFSLLPETWDQIGPNMPVVTRRFPLLDTTPIRTLVNGPESFTPDGEMLLGAVPGVGGLHVCTGMNSNGIALAAGAGRATAERLVHGRASFDVTALDVRRFMPFEGGDRYRHWRMSELFEVLCATPHPAVDFTRTRDIRRGPAHAVLGTRGPVRRSVAGYERALWYGDADRWVDAVTEELGALCTGAGLIDRCGDAKLWLEGPDALAVLRRLTGAPIGNAPGAACLAPLLDEHGAVQALPWAVSMGPDRVLLLAEPEDAVRLETVVRAGQSEADRCVVVEAGAGWAAFDLAGPEAPGVLADLAGAPASFAPGTAGRADLGFAPCWIVAFADWPVWRVLAPADHGAALAEALLERAAPAGHWASESLRVLHGVPRFGDEASLGIDAVAAGLAGALDLGRPFAGRDAVRGSLDAKPPRRIGRFTVPAGAGSLAGEPVVAGGRTVGHVTSSTYVPRDGRATLFALVEHGADGPCTLVDGAWVPLLPITPGR